MTARALMMRAVVICARSHKIVGFPDFYNVSIAKKAKLTVNFLAFPSVNFFFKFAHFEILTLPFTYYYFGKILSEQSSLMAKNTKSRDIGESV